MNIIIISLLTNSVHLKYQQLLRYHSYSALALSTHNVF